MEPQNASVNQGRDGGRRLKVVYICGRGRSGSTLLDNALGQIPGFFSAGEIGLGGRRLAENDLCGCGSPVGVCPVWQSIFTRAFGDPAHATEALKPLFAIGRARADMYDLALGAMGDLAPGARRRFARRHRQAIAAIGHFYPAIAAATGRHVIVDSTKFPPYGLALACAAEIDHARIDLHVLHLVRDPRAVSYSWLRQAREGRFAGAALSRRRFGPAHSAWRWLLANRASELFFRRLGHRYMRLRYEDFMSEPRRKLAEILDWLGEPVALPETIGADSLVLEPSHTISGNPSRFKKGRVTLKVDDHWRQDMPRGDRAMVAALTWRMRRRYGYGD